MKQIFLKISIAFIICIISFSCDKKAKLNIKENGIVNTSPKSLDSLISNLNGKVTGEYVGRTFTYFYDTTRLYSIIIDSSDYFVNRWTPLLDSNNTLTEITIQSNSNQNKWFKCDSCKMTNITFNKPYSCMNHVLWLLDNNIILSNNYDSLSKTFLSDSILRFCSRPSDFTNCGCDNSENSNIYTNILNGNLKLHESLYGKFQFEYNKNTDSVYFYLSYVMPYTTSISGSWQKPMYGKKKAVHENYVFRGKYIR